MKDKINKYSNTLYNILISLFIVCILVTDIIGVIQLPIYLNVFIGLITITAIVEMITQINFKGGKK